MLRHLSELALIRAIPDLTIGTLKPSRKKALFLQLQKAVDKDLRKFPPQSEANLDKVWRIVQEFGKQTGWLNQTRHIGTLFSFCLEIIEKSNFKFNPTISEIINKIISHLETGKDFKYSSCWAGSLAYEKWEGLFKEETHGSK